MTRRALRRPAERFRQWAQKWSTSRCVPERFAHGLRRRARQRQLAPYPLAREAPIATLRSEARPGHWPGRPRDRERPGHKWTARLAAFRRARAACPDAILLPRKLLARRRSFPSLSF